MAQHEITVQLEGSGSCEARIGKVASIHNDTTFKAGKLVARYRASDSTISSNDKVVSMKDLSSYQRDLVQEDEDKQPLIIEGSQNDVYDALRVGSQGWLSSTENINLEDKPFTHIAVFKVGTREPVPLMRIGSTDKAFNDHVHRVLLDFGRSNDDFKVDVASHGEPIEPSSYARTNWIPYNIGSEEFVIMASVNESEKASGSSFWINKEKTKNNTLVASNMLLDFDGPLSVGLFQKEEGRGQADLLEFMIFEGALGESALETVFSELDAAYDLTTKYLRSVLEGMGSFEPQVSGVFSIKSEMEGEGSIAYLLGRKTPLAATLLEGEGTMIPSVLRVRGLSAQLEGEGTLETDVEAQRGLSSSLEGEGSVDAGLELQNALEALLEGMGTVEVQPLRQRGISATLQGIGSVSVEFYFNEKYLEDVLLQGEGTLENVLAAILSLSSSMQGEGSFDYTLGAIKALQPSFESTGTLGNTIEARRGLGSYSWDGEGNIEYDLQMKNGFEVSLQGEGNVEPGLNGIFGLRPQLQGEGNVEPGLNGIFAFQPSFGGEGTVDPILDRQLGLRLGLEGKGDFEFTPFRSFIITTESNNDIIRAIDRDGKELWSYEAPDTVSRAKCDEFEQVYIVTWSEVIKLNKLGNVVWTHPRSGDQGTFRAVAPRVGGGAYIAEQNDGGWVTKVDSNGNEVWRKLVGEDETWASRPSDIYANANDSFNVLYNSTKGTDPVLVQRRIYQVSSDGTQTNFINVGEQGSTQFAVDRTRNRYVYNSDATNNLRRYNTSTGVVWQETVDGDVYDLDCDYKGDLYISAWDPVDEGTLRKFNHENGSLIWTTEINDDFIPGQLVVEPGPYFYVARRGSSSPLEIRKYRKDTGLEITNDDWPVTSTSTILDIGGSPGRVCTFPDKWEELKPSELGIVRAFQPSFEGTGTLENVLDRRLGLQSSLQGVGSFTKTTVFPDSNLYVGYYSDDSVKKLDREGNEVWSFEGHTDDILDVAADPDGNVYSASFDNTVRKIDPDGDEVWSFTGHISWVNGVAVDKDGFVYSASQDGTVKKINSSGSQVWSYSLPSGAGNEVEVDKDGFVYCRNLGVRKIDPDGNLVWYFDDESPRAMTVDGEGTVYITSGNRVKTLDKDGNVSGTFTNHTNDTYGVAIDDEFIYSCGQDDTVRKTDFNNNQIWSFTGHTDIVDSVEVDRNGFVYSASSFDNTVKKIDSDGNQIRSQSVTGSVTIASDPGKYSVYPSSWRLVDAPRLIAALQPSLEGEGTLSMETGIFGRVELGSFSLSGQGSLEHNQEARRGLSSSLSGVGDIEPSLSKRNGLGGLLEGTGTVTLGGSGIDVVTPPEGPFTSGFSNGFFFGSHFFAPTLEGSGTVTLSDLEVVSPSYYESTVVPIGSVVSHWSLDEEIGATTAVDSAGSNDGTINGSPTLESTTDVVNGGTSYEFDGSGDYINIGNTLDAVMANNDFSCSVWIKVTGTTNAEYILGNYSGSYWYMRWNDEDPALYVSSNVISGTHLATTAVDIGAAWHHLSVTFDRTSSTCKIYIDGVERASAALSASSMAGSSDFHIGNIGGGAEIPFQGFLDEVTVFSKALSSSEVSDLYNGGTL